MSDDNKALLAAAAEDKRNLAEGADVVVAKGDEKFPVPKVDPALARKAIFKNHRQHRADTIASDRETYPEMARLTETIEAESARTDRTSELDRGNHFDTETPRRPAAAPAQPTSKQPPLPGASERVTVQVNGKQFTVPKADVDAAGGIDAYQKQRAATMALSEAGELRRQAHAEREAALKLKADLEARASAHATGAAPVGTPPQGASGAAAVQAQAEEMVSALFSGDRAKAAKAVADILSRSQNPGALDPSAVAAQVAAQQRQPAQPPQRQRSADEVQQINETNEMMRAEFADILADKELEALALGRFRKMLADPENHGRLMKDVAREAASGIRERYVNPRQRVVDIKRSQLPPQPSGSGRAPAEVEAPPMPRGSSYVEALNARRRGTPPTP